jgi:hypothetical protein
MVRTLPKKMIFLLLIAAILVPVVCVVAATESGNSADLPLREAMIRVLGSANPNPSLGKEAQTFDRLVGSWDADFSFPQADGTVRHKKGELHFGWVMDGHAVQDLWIGYPTGEQKERTIGTTFRFFDTKLKQWRIVFINPQYNYVVNTQGGREVIELFCAVRIPMGFRYAGHSVKLRLNPFTGPAKNHTTAGTPGFSRKITTRNGVQLAVEGALTVQVRSEHQISLSSVRGGFRHA